MIGRWLLYGLIAITIGCAGATKPRNDVLPTPPAAKPETAKLMEEGRRLYAARDWAGAEQQYAEAVKLQPTLAEAHYNLGMTLYVQRKDGQARKHFVEAQNLAPGDKLIWDAPPFREYGYVPPSARPDTGTKMTPTIGLH